MAAPALSRREAGMVCLSANQKGFFKITQQCPDDPNVLIKSFFGIHHPAKWFGFKGASEAQSAVFHSSKG
jgi:hypothetical protein